MTNQEPTLIERAHQMLRQAERYGDLDEEQLMMAAAMGASPMKAQEARLHYAAVLALLSIAESLATLEDVAWTAGLLAGPGPSQVDERIAADG